MPLRRGLSLAAPLRRPPRQFFHASAVRRDDFSNDHYETLGVTPDSTPAEIKKSFYALSKAHHPDHNPNDPSAARTFMRLSEAYSVLGTPAKRAAYDRDVLRLHDRDRDRHSPRGSYHSTNPAGGRTPSGLSRRRGQFRGPPPSFYRAGGWGDHTDRRRAAHEQSTGGAAGMGPGQGARGDVPHFDRDAHRRTHEHLARRLAQRARERAGGAGGDGGMLGGFLTVCGVLLVSFSFPMYLFSGGEGGTGKQRKAA